MVRDLLAGSDGETQTTAVSHGQGSDEPGFAFLDTILRHRLASDGD